jgi:hypothetical protein
MRIAILDADVPVPAVRAVKGLYSDIFEALLREAAEELPEYKDTELQFKAYDSVKGELPIRDELAGFGGIVVTGSGMFCSLVFETN